MLSNKRRSNIEISAEILKVALHGAKKSHIVYRANLNFEVVKKYLKRLNESGLINFPNFNNRIFKTTPKGREYINRYENLNTYMKVK
jgi:predicted transcriptional regulator